MKSFSLINNLFYLALHFSFLISSYIVFSTNTHDIEFIEHVSDYTLTEWITADRVESSDTPNNNKWQPYPLEITSKNIVNNYNTKTRHFSFYYIKGFIPYHSFKFYPRI